ncbi:Flp pilus assembly protein TadG [Agrobacterium vitis]|nr:Flp pilus assembly protein TadG [Agrobacterium vitis]MBE1437201.1 Flp pilus assembly protein TadG [Agrobacterium vitis]
MRLWGHIIKPMGSRFRQMMQDRSGIGAVEFALIVPLLLLLYLGAFELTLGLGIASRATSSAGAIADIVARKESSFTKSFLATMPDVAAGIFAPKSTTGYGLKISGIQVDASLNGKIVWSWAQDGTTPYVVGAAVTLPSGMAAASTSFVHVEFSIPYRLVAYLPGMAGSSASTITISRDYYYRQRTTDAVTCSDC